MKAAKPALVGAFVLSGLALAVIGVVLIAGSQIFTRHAHAVTYFTGSVAGLEVGAPVTFRGVKVGSVTRIGLHIDLNNGSESATAMTRAYFSACGGPASSPSSTCKASSPVS
jgi:ABC-type transporter Mla subunit MlaD